jgi:hypothetical protein
MLKMTAIVMVAGGFLALAGTTAFAADLAAAPAPSKNNTISIEFSPEYKATDSSLADDYLKFGLSHTFDNNVVLGSSFQYTWRNDAAHSSVDQLEASLGYKLKSGAFTLTPSAIVGYGFGNAPKINPAVGTDPEAYYAFAVAADVKLDDHWTWNAFNARYRNAFNVTWITPKVSTGVTYKIDGSNAVYLNVGYAWKDKGDGNGLLGDKWNVAVGYKFSF